MAEDANVQQVVQRALDDPQFGAELREKGLKAVHAGAQSPEWGEFFSLFASGPEGLSAMGGDASVAACTCHSRTVITTSTPLCTTTTTTTSS